jgi:hypothetical protein
VVRHDFSSSGGGPSSSGGGGGGGGGAPPISSSGGAPVGGGGASGGSGGRIIRTSQYSNSNKTGLTRAGKLRVSAAMAKAARRHPGDTIHTLMTSNGSPYQNIQGRIM